MKKISLITILLISFFTFSQAPYVKKAEYRIAVFLIDFDDIPTDIRSQWPTHKDWERRLFHSKIQDYFKQVSNDEFVITGDIFDYHTSNLILWDENTDVLATPQQILSSINFNATGFNFDNYDRVAFLSSHDARISVSNLGSYDFNINGTAFTNQSILFLSCQNGYWSRDMSNGLSDTFVQKKSYIIPTGVDSYEVDLVWHDYSQSEATFCHEIGHALGVQAHANSRTNSGSYDYEEEVPNNIDYYDNEYGNFYDIMGTQSYGMGLNGSFRNFMGLLPQDDIKTVDQLGVQTITIHPINSTENNRYLEVLLPFENEGFGYKNKGYGLEVRKVDDLDAMMAHPQLQQNVEGIMVHKIYGLSSLLIDMSPSPNFEFSWGPFYDIRDVVLKPGMTYENDEVKFNNVINNGDVSFTLDVEIKSDKNWTPAPTGISAVTQGSSQVLVTWENNHLTSGNTANLTVEFRNPSVESFWQTASTSIANNATSYLTGFGTGAGSVYEFRIMVQENDSNLQSLPSNIVTNGCNVKIENLITYPVSCNGTNDGKIEVLVSGGAVPYQYKVENGNYQSSNLIENLAPGIHNITVKDANDCEFTLVSPYIGEPKSLTIDAELDGSELTIKANYGTGNYEYRVNAGAWQESPVFSGVIGDYNATVRDRNGCEATFYTLGVEDVLTTTFSVYPNPTSGIINIKGLDNPRTSISIYNLLGQEIKRFDNVSGSISISSFAQGCYFLKIMEDRKIIGINKIIKY